MNALVLCHVGIEFQHFTVLEHNVPHREIDVEGRIGIIFNSFLNISDKLSALKLSIAIACKLSSTQQDAIQEALSKTIVSPSPVSTIAESAGVTISANCVVNSGTIFVCADTLIVAAAVASVTISSYITSYCPSAQFRSRAIARTRTKPTSRRMVLGAFLRTHKPSFTPAPHERRRL